MSFCSKRVGFLIHFKGGPGGWVNFRSGDYRPVSAITGRFRRLQAVSGCYRFRRKFRASGGNPDGNSGPRGEIQTEIQGLGRKSKRKFGAQTTIQPETHASQQPESETQAFGAQLARRLGTVHLALVRSSHNLEGLRCSGYFQLLGP